MFRGNIFGFSMMVCDLQKELSHHHYRLTRNMQKKRAIDVLTRKS